MNFFLYEKISLFRSYYIYVDSKQYLADDIFIKNNIKVKFEKELKYSDSDYKIMLVSVSNRKDYLFVKAMCELEEKMLNKGFDNYEEICNEVFNNLSKSKKKVKKCII